MKYRILEKEIIEYQAERVLAVLTANSARGVALDEKELSLELHISEDTAKKALISLTIAGKIEEVSDIPRLTPAT